ncbi:MAG: D-amino-acid transaminase [Firmicutes bacterium]|nr:D-amino-acid transaminase [Bacillota bacterium]
MHVYFNGTVQEETAIKISMDDRGFLFGDGVYEGIRVYPGYLFAWERHMRRLQNSLNAVEIAFDPQTLEQPAHELLKHFPEQHGVLYIQITRGIHPRAHAYPDKGVLPPTVLMWIRPAEALTPEAVQQGVFAITTADQRWSQVWIKSLNLLPNVLAKTQAQKVGAYEAIFLRDGFVTEATMSNVFIVKDQVVRTAPATNYILPGITREIVLELARQGGISFEERPFSLQELHQADEVFVTNSIAEILPVTQVDEQTIGSGEAGSVTLSLRRLFQSYVNQQQLAAAYL